MHIIVSRETTKINQSIRYRGNANRETIWNTKEYVINPKEGSKGGIRNKEHIG